MQINFPFNVQNVSYPNFKGIENKKLPEAKPDEFIKSTPDKSSYDKGFEYAKQKCAQTLQGGSAYEYSVAIDEDGNVLYETKGEEKHCNLCHGKLKPNMTVVHGHPGEKLKPLSPQDVITFLKTPEIKKMTAVDKNENSCSLEKPEGFLLFNNSSLDARVNEIFMKNWLDVLGISYEIDEDYMDSYENKLKEHFGISDKKELFGFLYGSSSRPEDSDTALGTLRFQCCINGITMNEPYVDKFLSPDADVKDDSDLEIQILDSFLNKICEEYNVILKYE